MAGVEVTSGDLERGRTLEVKPLSYARQSSGRDIGDDVSRYLSRWAFKQWMAVLLFGLSVFSLAVLFLLQRQPWSIALPQDSLQSFRPSQSGLAYLSGNEYLTKGSQRAVVGPATAKFRDNLRNDTLYITSWLSAGFTNDIMTLGNLIYLARMTNRVPVLPPLDSFIGKRPNAIPFSSVFDLPRLERELGMNVIEWRDVKDPTSEELDILGCWNVFQVADAHATEPRFSRNAMFLKVDLSYTRAPPSVKLIPGFEHDSHSSFWALAPLAFPDMRAKALASMTIETLPGPWTGTVALPDEQLLCYDYLYYVCADAPFEYDKDVYPSWQVVQKHFRWTTEVERVGQAYLRKVLKVSSGATIPPHITIHARHGDFRDWCSETDPQACFAPLSTFSRRVAEVQSELRTRKGAKVEHVIMTSDEQDERWWDQVSEMGWLRIDHRRENTTERHGEWYPVILDAYVQSAGFGFVGTDRSTFSTLSRLRVRDWNDGAVRMVKWGRPDADDH